MRNLKFFFLIFTIGALSIACFLDATRIEREWNRNRGIIEDSVAGTATRVEFEKAHRFFFNLTGIAAPVGSDYVGTFPIPETLDTLRVWDLWYQQNRHRLRWDDENSTVKIKE